MSRVRIFAFLLCLTAFGLQAQDSLRLPRQLKVSQKSLVAHWTMKNPGSGDSATCDYNVYYQTYSGKRKFKKLAGGLNQLMHNAVNTDTAHSQLSIDERVKKDAEEFRQEWAALNTDMENVWTYNYVKRQDFRLVYLDKNFATVRDEAYYFTGGAHGFGVTVYSVLSAKTGQPVEGWRSLVTDTAALLQLAETAFRELKKIPEGTPTSQEWFWNGKFYLTDNFAFTGQGLVFYYNQYEIAPYAAGATELLLPWNSIRQLLKTSR